MYCNNSKVWTFEFWNWSFGYPLALFLPVPAGSLKVSLLLRLRVPARSFASCTRWLSFNLFPSDTDKFMYLLYPECFDFRSKNQSFSFHKSTGNKIFPGHPSFSSISGYRLALLLPAPARHWKPSSSSSFSGTGLLFCSLYPPATVKCTL